MSSPGFAVTVAVGLLFAAWRCWCFADHLAHSVDHIVAGRGRDAAGARAAGARIGEHVVAGTPLAWVWSASLEHPTVAAETFGAALDAAVRIGFERTLEQDPGLGLRQLVDLACKALSPAINDPYTAIQAIERLAVLFTALAARPVVGGGARWSGAWAGFPNRGDPVSRRYRLPAVPTLLLYGVASRVPSGARPMNSTCSGRRVEEPPQFAVW